jgi:hypothetical protein
MTATKSRNGRKAMIRAVFDLISAATIVAAIAVFAIIIGG